MVEYQDRKEGEIYKDIEKNYNAIKNNFNRDDEDAYKAAMSTINSYIQQDFELFNEINLNTENINNDSSVFVFQKYADLFKQLQEEHDNLEKNETDHWLRTSVEPHIQRLAGRINEAEYDTLINRRVHDAKYELINKNIMIDAIPIAGDPKHSAIDTPPVFRGSANGKTISEVLEYSKKQNPNISDDLTYTVDYTKSTNPDLQKYGVVRINGYGKCITRQGGETEQLNYTDLPAREGVTIASNKYLKALEDYQNNNKSSYEKYNRPGGIDETAGNNYNKLFSFGNPEDFKTFEDMLENLGNSENYETTDINGEEISIKNEYRECITLINNNPTLKSIFENLFNNNIDKSALYEFLAKSETKLDHIVQKNKKTGFILSEAPITTTSPGLAQANFIGEVDIDNEDTKGAGIREVLFCTEDGRYKGQRCSLTRTLYESLDKDKKALQMYLTERIRQKWGDGKYARMELKEKEIQDSEFKKIDKTNKESQEEAKEQYELKEYGVEEMLKLCDEFSTKYSQDENFQPTQLVKIQKYLNNVLRDLEEGYINGKLPTDNKWSEICKEVQKNWIEFKDNDGFFASMTDSYANRLIFEIFHAEGKTYAEKREIIQTSIKELGNGMTFLDNTTGSGAVKDAIADNRDEESEGGRLYIDNPEFDACREKINQDFSVKINDDGEIISNLKPIENLFNAYHKGWGEVDVFDYLQKNGYLPKKARVDDEQIRGVCSNIVKGLGSKMELYENQSEWKVTKEKIVSKLLKEKEELSKKENLTDKEIAYINGIDALINDKEQLEDIAKEQNESALISIMCGDMQELIAGGFTDYLISEGGGVKTKGGKRTKKTEMINDSYGIGLLDLNDANCEKASEILGQILEEVAICAVAIAIGSVTAGMGGAAILALRGSVLAVRGAKLISTIKRVRGIAKLCKMLGTATKYVSRIGSKIKSSRLIAGNVAEAATETKAITSTVKTWHKGAKIMEIYQSGKETIEGMKIAGFILEGTGFHVANTAIHNAINGNPIGEGLNPFGSTEYVDPETGEVKETSNFRGYVESIAFIGVLKAVGAPIQQLTYDGLTSILSKNALGNGLGKFFQVGGSIAGELLSLQATEQALSLAFDQKLKDITIEDFIHSVGMVIGLRMTRLFGKAVKYTVKKYDRAKGEAEIDVEGESITVNKEGEVYFNGKGHKTNVTEAQARSNSTMMDELCGGKEKNEISKEEKEKIRKEIKEQYKKEKGEELELTDEQIDAIIKAHLEEGTLGELTTEQLMKKNRILDEANIDPEVRRFLLESGFCGSFLNKLKSILGIEETFDGGYKIGDIVKIKTSDGKFVDGEIAGFDTSSREFQIIYYKNGLQITQRFMSSDLNYFKHINSQNKGIDIIGQGGYKKGDSVLALGNNGYTVSAVIIELNPKAQTFKISRREGNRIINNRVTKEQLDIMAKMNDLKVLPNVDIWDYELYDEVKIRGINGRLTNATITKIFLDANKFKVERDENGKKHCGIVSQETLDLLNKSDLKNDTQEVYYIDELDSSEIDNTEDAIMALGSIVTIPRSKGEPTQATVVRFNSKTNSYIVKWIENNTYCYKKLPKKTIDEYNRGRYDVRIVDDYNPNDNIEFAIPVDEQVNNVTRKSLDNNDFNLISNSRKTDTAKIYLDKGFYPKNKVEFGAGNCLYVTDKIINSKGRPIIIGYSYNNGSIHLRMFYRSNSEGCWRSCPGRTYSKNGPIYSKGDFIENHSYETTTKVDPRIGESFDNLNETSFGGYDPIMDVGKELYEKYEISGELLRNEMKTSIEVSAKLFTGLGDSAVSYYMGESSIDVINGYSNLIPSGLDYMNMRINPKKSYSYKHEFLGYINVEVCTIKRNGIDLDFHFSRAADFPNKIRIDNVVFSDAQLNSFGVYNKQINASPLTAKPIDYATYDARQVPRDRNGKRFGGTYMDIRDLYQGNPIIQRYREIAGIY